jgi:hypothetical protein
MIPFLLPLLTRFPLLTKLPWKAIGVAALVLLLTWRALAWVEGERDEREAEIRVLWEADTAARDKVSAEAIAKAEADKAIQLALNAQELEHAKEKLAAASADRDAVAGLLNRARDQVRRLAANEATGQRGADVFAGIAARAAEVDQRLADYDAACRRDAIRLQALQDQLRPQL